MRYLKQGKIIIDFVIEIQMMMMCFQSEGIENPRRRRVIVVDGVLAFVQQQCQADLSA